MHSEGLRHAQLASSSRSKEFLSTREAQLWRARDPMFWFGDLLHSAVVGKRIVIEGIKDQCTQLALTATLRQLSSGFDIMPRSKEHAGDALSSIDRHS